MTTAKDQIEQHKSDDGLSGEFFTPPEGPALFAIESGPVMIVLSRDEYDELKCCIKNQCD